MQVAVLSDFQTMLFERIQASGVPFDDELSRLVDENKAHPTFYSDLVYLLGNIKTSNATAKTYLRQVMEHKSSLEAQRGSPVDLRVAFMDYFVHVQPKYRHPKIVELVEYRNHLAQAATDPLTGLYNRTYFKQIGEREIARSQRHGYEFGLLLMDVDHFKLINDNHGHASGDLVLKNIGAFMKEALRSEDFAFRFGGEEFVLLLPQTGEQGMMQLVHRLSATRPVLFPGGPVVTWSAGMSLYPRDGETLDDLLQKADLRMYKAKAQGRNRTYLDDSACLNGTV